MTPVIAAPRVDWAQALARVIADPLAPTLVFQPVVDLRRGIVVGYETLSRFDGPPNATPDRWFAAAAREGLAAQLEARVIDRALQARAELPANCFLSVNVDPNLVTHPAVQDVFERARPLHGVVAELTEHAAVHDMDELMAEVTKLRRRGLHIALDDAGAGYSGLQQILTMRPEFLKLDISLVSDLDVNEAKYALVEMLGQFAGRIDSWIIAEGIERLPELDALIQLRVPLGQGYLLARPAPMWATVGDTATSHIVERVTADAVDQTIAEVVERVPAIPDRTLHVVPAPAEGSAGHVGPVVVDGRGRPVAVLAADGQRQPALCVKATSLATDVARRAMTRPHAARFLPLVCCDELGAYVGIVRIERLIQTLAD
jgi:EAL domain-containing protein (putative c-di-GMP-specific phosphodiesterase class I)